MQRGVLLGVVVSLILLVSGCTGDTDPERVMQAAFYSNVTVEIGEVDENSLIAQAKITYPDMKACFEKSTESKQLVKLFEKHRRTVERSVSVTKQGDTWEASADEIQAFLTEEMDDAVFSIMEDNGGISFDYEEATV